MTIPAPIGSHGLLDLYGCDPAQLRDTAYLQQALENAAHAACATILGRHFHHFGDQAGVTGVLLLAESHLSIHTWPEHCFAAIDVFLCGGLHTEAARLALERSLPATHRRWQILTRGERHS